MRTTSTALLLVLGFPSHLYGQGDTASLSAALTARVPGVQVQSRDGSAGAGPVITVRGAAEPLISARPLLIIDGVRVDNTQGVDNPSASGHPATARFDDIHPSEIERIEVLPGSAASALYGPGAGNGVILVTTRHGGSRFLYGSVSAEGGWTSMPRPETLSYFAWGHATNDGSFQQCKTYQAAAGECVVDSVSHFNPLLDAATTPVASGTSERVGGELGASVHGFRGYVAGHYTYNDGNLAVPHDVTPSSATGYHLNTAHRSDVRAQVSSDIGRTMDVGVMASYSDVRQRVPGVDSLLIAGALNPGHGPPGWPEGSNYPEQMLADLVTNHATHSTVSGYGNWHPLAPLTIHARVGEDGTAVLWAPIPYPNSMGPFGPGVVSGIFPVHGGIIQFTSDVGANVALKFASWLASRTAVGVQYLDAHQHANARVADHTQSAYASQGVTIADRLTVDAGARWNHEWLHLAHATSTAIDPSLRGRLIVLGHDSTAHIGLRGAIGETHTVPPLDAVGVLLTSYNPLCGFSGGVQCLPTNRPRFVAERQREAEGGVIAGLADDRLTLDLTVFERRNVDVLVPALVGFNGGMVQVDSGAGITRDDGLEITIGARPIVTKAVSWDLTLTGFVNENKLLRLGYPGPLLGPSNFMELAAGHPVYGIYAATYTYADANNDGVIEPSEVTVASFPSYVGPARPTREAALSSSIALWHGHLTVGALADYRGGFVLPDLAGYDQAAYLTARAVNLPGASLADQARAIAGGESVFAAGQVQRVNAIRWRELSLSAPLPFVAGPTVRLTVAARNLALWTNYRGPDPDADVATGNAEQLRLPQPRMWLLRATAAF